VTKDTKAIKFGREAFASRLTHAFGLTSLAVAAVMATHTPALAQSNKVRISDLTDVSYGTVTNLQADSRRSQSICVSASASSGLYSVTAWGTGPGGALELSNGLSTMPYSVEWSQTPNQAGGTTLAANLALVSQSTPERQQDCKSRGLQTASLIVVLRGADLSRAIEGAYSGTLNILLAAQ
jgi:hypothetical protein